MMKIYQRELDRVKTKGGRISGKIVNGILDAYANDAEQIFQSGLPRNLVFDILKAEKADFLKNITLRQFTSWCENKGFGKRDF